MPLTIILQLLSDFTARLQIQKLPYPAVKGRCKEIAERNDGPLGGIVALCT